METVYLLEVTEHNSYSYDGTVSNPKGIFTTEDDAHKAGKALVNSGYVAYLVEPYTLNKTY